jgi:hypothetical protein
MAADAIMLFPCSILPERSALDITESLRPPLSRSLPRSASNSVLEYFLSGVALGAGVALSAGVAAVPAAALWVAAIWLAALWELAAVAEADPVTGVPVLAGPLHAVSPAARAVTAARTCRTGFTMLPQYGEYAPATAG